MTTKFPRITGDQMIKYLIKKGFTAIRQRGSHVSMRNDNIFTSVPRKTSKLGIGLTFTILKDSFISKDEFLEDYKQGLVK